MAASYGNKYALGNRGGRPPMYESADELSNRCAAYFEYCDEQKVKATITGLALWLGFDSRQSLYDYEDKQEFTYIIKRAKLAVENSYETSATAFDIFALKNMGWKDKTEQEIHGALPVTLNETRNYQAK
jgi:hypothetical protein